VFYVRGLFFMCPLSTLYSTDLMIIQDYCV